MVSYVNITSLRLEDGGLYRCEAVNDAGMAHHTQMVHIKGKPYIRPMSNITVLAGQQVSIRCPASGFPLSRITWFKGMLSSLGDFPCQRIEQKYIVSMFHLQSKQVVKSFPQVIDIVSKITVLCSSPKLVERLMKENMYVKQ